MAERLYTISGQRQVRGLDGTNNLVDMYEISYTGPGAITGSVRIPISLADPAYVDARIRDALNRQLQIAQLGQPT